MKVLILAGGFGTRLSEQTEIKPKPMVEIGGKPILWHILKIYSTYGYNDFVILLGYKGYVIKEFFANYFLHQSDLTIDIKNNKIEIHDNYSENWKITLVDTGAETLTGGRIKRAGKFVDNEPFLLTYGDGVSDVDIQKLVEFHKSHGKLATMTAIQPEGRFGALDISKNNEINSFIEKPKGDNAWINGGFFVCQPEVLNYINGDETIFEKEPLEKLAKEGQLQAFKHDGFWQCMDTLRDKNRLEDEWSTGKAPWKKW
ncbi:MAG: glucose-1-phosphate cytidylyltransferase [Bacteroidetes bacterium]|jgi:glucose-1-phosphate cytidylyltransferase|nr:glucose-1-phosphate cytidylyltransferase [Bacteroidota bacterium]MBP7255469.1 glucose-1-phosphate cytidylyltransferase [Chitinophagales bacterium]MBK7137816.1 glucose-1-phosphate cytidylyltransferase [Bacteroidota bacterium]MBK7504696.1 glucose-1-phosphate cytidylyltransferase [Bacteroidota bacterium]MBK7641041.1 glucose-1-phosphate cytidylyltransferase [Bacteroidota bacterium]